MIDVVDLMCTFRIEQALRVATQYASTSVQTASWEYFRIYSPVGICSGRLAI